MLFVVGVIVSAILCALSAFFGLTYLIYQYQTNLCVRYDGVLIFFSITFLINLLIFLRLMQKKYWIKALFIDELKY